MLVVWNLADVMLITVIAALLSAAIFFMIHFFPKLIEKAEELTDEEVEE